MLKAQDCLLGTLYGRYGQQKWMWYIARNSVFEPLCIGKFNMAIVKNYKCKLNLVKLAISVSQINTTYLGTFISPIWNKQIKTKIIWK